MSKNMTDAEFAGKVEWEGGVWEALEYGLRASDLEDQFSPLSRAWRRVENAFLVVQDDLQELENLLEEAQEDDGS